MTTGAIKLLSNQSVEAANSNCCVYPSLQGRSHARAQGSSWSGGTGDRGTFSAPVGLWSQDRTPAPATGRSPCPQAGLDLPRVWRHAAQEACQYGGPQGICQEVE